MSHVDAEKDGQAIQGLCRLPTGVPLISTHLKLSLRVGQIFCVLVAGISFLLWLDLALMCTQAKCIIHQANNTDQQPAGKLRHGVCLATAGDPEQFVKKRNRQLLYLQGQHAIDLDVANVPPDISQNTLKMASAASSDVAVAVGAC